ncbi:N-6 DNA methylase [Turicibacter sanguinis]|uniref:N-6 DNA methylase n=1 Tax=Turicibacter sanguinis TaxID=154288 RepID=UPI00189A088C|nr:N-6 DNA methylase [Turicibacter sanguinis]
MQLAAIYDKLKINLGEVYTPNKLSDFVSMIIMKEYLKHENGESLVVLDPACGDGSLLNGLQKNISELKEKINHIEFHGCDINSESINIAKKRFGIQEEINFKWFVMDSIIPEKGKKYVDGWESRTNKKYDIIITNPPWGADLLHSKLELQSAGYINTSGQIDSYYLFVEMCYNLLNDGGICLMILPDSIFGQEAMDIREYLVKNTELKLISKLGEKIFPGVNRATSLIMFRKNKSLGESNVACFRLDSDSRIKYLKDEVQLDEVYEKKHHMILQSRFLNNNSYEFDIDTKDTEIELVDKIKSCSIDWDEYFNCGRGVEISKNGVVARCMHCGNWQGITKKQYKDGYKKCNNCDKETAINQTNVDILVSKDNCKEGTKFLVGENIKRFEINGNRYLKMGYKGINYKDEDGYKTKKLLIRKTGLGINAVIDYTGTIISQTIYYYILKEEKDFDLEYVLGILNSRVIFYYYLKKYGENEWKSHPYLTHTIIKDLPIKKINDENKEIASEISNLVKKILERGYSNTLDKEIEKLVMSLYNINEMEKKMIMDEINKLPNLSSINHMKIEVGDIINV